MSLIHMWLSGAHSTTFAMAKSGRGRETHLLASPRGLDKAALATCLGLALLAVYCNIVTSVSKNMWWGPPMARVWTKLAQPARGLAPSERISLTVPSARVCCGPGDAVPTTLQARQVPHWVGEDWRWRGNRLRRRATGQD